MSVFKSSTEAREILLRIRAGEPSATDSLFSHCMERFRLLSGRIFSTHRDLRGAEERDDLLAGRPDPAARRRRQAPP